MPGLIYDKGVWVDDDGSNTLGTPITKARMDNIENGVGRAHQALNDHFSLTKTVRFVAVANMSLNALPIAFDGIDTYATGERVLLTAQNNPAQNGIYVINVGQVVPLVRAADFDEAVELRAGQTISVTDGKTFGGSTWVLATDQPNVGVDAIAFTKTQDSSKLAAVDGRVTTLESGGLVKIGDAQLVGGNSLWFYGIPQTFTHLRIVAALASTRAGSTNTGCRFNCNNWSGNEWACGYDGYLANARVEGYIEAQPNGYLGQIPAGSKGSDGCVFKTIIDVLFYRDTSGQTINARGSGQWIWGTGASLHYNVFNTNLLRSGPITQFGIFDDVFSALAPTAKATLYGIK